MKNAKKKQFLPILLADDLSLQTEQDARSIAVKTYAQGMAQGMGTTIDLVHIEDLLLYPVYKGRYKPIIDKYFAEQKKKLALSAKSFSVRTHARFLSGNPTQTLLKLANQRNAYEMIAVGTHGRTGLGRILLGSVAEEVIRQSKIPVFTVGPEAQDNSQKFLQTAQPTLVVATSLNRNSQKAEIYGIRLAKKLGAKLIFSYSLSDLFKSFLLFPGGSNQIREMISDAERDAEKVLSKKVAAAKKEGVSALIMMDGKAPSASDSIMRAVKMSSASLVVMGTQGRSLMMGAFYGRTVRDLILQSPVPVITVR